jgi:hypothetical protein
VTRIDIVQENKRGQLSLTPFNCYPETQRVFAIQYSKQAPTQFTEAPMPGEPLLMARTCRRALSRGSVVVAA